MSLPIKRSALGFLVAAAFLPSSPSSARIVHTPGCQAAEKLEDGSWLIRSSTAFGRAGTVDSGAIVYKGTVINGVDVGAVLEKRCFLDYRVEPDYDSFVWTPNGFLSWVTPLQ
ncbi:MAG TPA: hypothetical protein VMI72_09310 [Roseiarcus sp.]|nr:hypothetical protein [Roseiarcus sp.]